MKLLRNDNRITKHKENLLVGLKTGQIEVYKDKNLAHLEDEMDAYKYDETFSNRKGLASKNDGKNGTNEKDSTSKPKKLKTRQLKAYEHSNKNLTKHFRKFKFRTAFIYALNRWHVNDNEYMEPLLNCLFELQRLKALGQALNGQSDRDISRLVSYVNKFIFNKTAHWVWFVILLASNRNTNYRVVFF